MVSVEGALGAIQSEVFLMCSGLVTAKKVPKPFVESLGGQSSFQNAFFIKALHKLFCDLASSHPCKACLREGAT